MLELKGSIRVLCRIRPFVEKEQANLERDRKGNPIIPVQVKTMLWGVSCGGYAVGVRCGGYAVGGWLWGVGCKGYAVGGRLWGVGCGGYAVGGMLLGVSWGLRGGFCPTTNSYQGPEKNRRSGRVANRPPCKVWERAGRGYSLQAALS